MIRKDGAIFMEQEEYDNLLQTFSEEQKKSISYDPDTKQLEYHLSLYESNQQLINGLPTLNDEQIAQSKIKMKKWLLENNDRYYMLLCKDYNYYTVFTYEHGAINDMVESVTEIAFELGEIKVMEEDSSSAFAFWIKIENNRTEALDDTQNLPYCFYLFPYGRGIVEV